MKYSIEIDEPEFTPVVVNITLGTQEEVDLLYAVLMYKPVVSFLGDDYRNLRDELPEKDYDLYYRKLVNNIRVLP